MQVFSEPSNAVHSLCGTAKICNGSKGIHPLRAIRAPVAGYNATAILNVTCDDSLPAPRYAMRIHYFGDSYDIVKQSLLRWLSTFGEWSVHPMFTEMVSRTDVAAFELLLNAKIVSTEVLTRETDRSAYFARATSCGHLFLDPDTGLRMRSTRGAR